MRETLRAVGMAVRITVSAGPWTVGVWVASNLVSIFSSLVVTVLSRRVVNAITAGQAGRTVSFALAAAAVLTAGQGAFALMLAWYPKVLEIGTLRTDEEVVTAVLALPAQEHASADVLDRLEQLRQVRAAPVQVVYLLSMFLMIGGHLAVALVLLGQVSPLLLTLPLFSLPLLWAMQRRSAATIRLQQDVAADRRGALALFRTGTSAACAAELRAFGTAALLTRRWDARRLLADRRADRVGVRTAGPVLAGEALFAAGFLAAIGLVVHQALAGEASLGDVVLTVGLAGTIAGLTSGLTNISGQFTVSLAAVRRLVWLADRAAEHRRSAVRGTRAAPERLSEGLRLQGVAYTYPGADGAALEAVDLVLPAGAVVALVGENGAGKSTLVSLLLGLTSPDEGSITVDGTPLTALDPESWQAATSVVLQDHTRFELLVRETVGIGAVEHVGDAALVQAAVGRGAATSVVATLPDGLETMLGTAYGQGGRELSGGEWQRLAVARGFMREQPLLRVLDEPTAALDAATEAELFASYRDAAGAAMRAAGGITVLVTHRFSTVRDADLIVVLERGRVVEVGNHAALTAAGGLYAELYELQAAGYR